MVSRKKFQNHDSRLLTNGEEPFDLVDHLFDVFLTVECDHKEIVACLEADHSVAEKPDAFEQRIAADDRADGESGDVLGIEDIGHHHCTGRKRKGSEQRCSDPFCDVAFKLDAFGVGLAELALFDHFLAAFQITVKFFAELLDRPGRDRGIEEPM